MSLENFTRGKETLWYPVLLSCGFKHLGLSRAEVDYEQATDVIGKDSKGKDVRFAARVRGKEGYSESCLASWYRQVTIRYSYPTGSRTEWDKIFTEQAMVESPDYFLYGWLTDNRRTINPYVILVVKVLRELYSGGLLRPYIAGARENTDWRRSKFIPLPLRDLAGMAWPGNLVYRHSPNHPAFE